MITAADILTVAFWLGMEPSKLLALRTTRSTVEKDSGVNAERFAKAE